MDIAQRSATRPVAGVFRTSRFNTVRRPLRRLWRFTSFCVLQDLCAVRILMS